MDTGAGGAHDEEWQAVSSNFSLPLDMQFNHGHVVSICAYSALMLVSAVGNCTVFGILLRRRLFGRASRLDTLLLHLAIADLLVTFLMMPLEIGWAATVQWLAGDVVCRLMAFLRTFGLYLSSFILVCIAVDRYCAVLKPLQVVTDRRMHGMVTGAWLASCVCSLPQAYIFHVEAHPSVPWYEQCVTYGVFATRGHELAYSAANMVLMYALPLAATCYCYAAVLLELIRKADQTNDKVRRSGLGLLGRARVRTLKMTITILLVFFVCWTPYYVMCLWYWVDKESAKLVDPGIQRALFIFACTNSCANPIVYGAFNIRRGQDTRRGRAFSSSNGALRRRTCLSFGDSTELPSYPGRANTRLSLVPSENSTNALFKGTHH